MAKFTDTSEKGFQKLIVKELVVKNGYVESTSKDFDTLEKILNGLIKIKFKRY